MFNYKIITAMNELTLFNETMDGAQSTSDEQRVKALSSSNDLNNANNVVEVCDDEFEDIDLEDFKYDYRTDNPAVYVGSYKKYNNGLLDGMWVDLTLCADYDEFMRVCHCIHRDEGEDVEFMFQDMQNFPDSWYDESSLDEETFDRIIEFAEMDEDDRKAFEVFMDVRCDSDVTFEEFRDCYCGAWDSEEEFAEQLVDELGILDEVPEHLRRFFDMEAYSEELFRYDYDYSEGYVYRVN